MGYCSLDSLLKTTDMSHRVTGGTGYHSGLYSAFSSYVGTDYVLWSASSGQYSNFPFSYSNNNFVLSATDGNTGWLLLPIIPTKIASVSFDVKFTNYSPGVGEDFIVNLESNQFNATKVIQRTPPTITGEWEHIEYTVSSPIDFYYISFSTCASWEIKNFNMYAIETTPSGGAGSGYIGNSLLSNKKMVGYNVPTSEAESTKTESIGEYSDNPVSGKPKGGNGFAKIKLLREIPRYSFRDLTRILDIDHKQVTTQWADISPLSQYYNSDYILVTQQNNGNYFTSFDGIDGIGRDTVSYTGCRMYVPIKPIRAVSAKASVKIEPSSRTSPYSLIHLYLGHLENNEWTTYHIGGIQINGTESEWTEISKIFDSPINAEYIIVYSMDNQWHFKNLEIVGDLV